MVRPSVERTTGRNASLATAQEIDTAVDVATGQHLDVAAVELLEFRAQHLACGIHHLHRASTRGCDHRHVAHGIACSDADVAATERTKALAESVEARPPSHRNSRRATVEEIVARHLGHLLLGQRVGIVAVEEVAANVAARRHREAPTALSEPGVGRRVGRDALIAGQGRRPARHVDGR